MKSKDQLANYQAKQEVVRHRLERNKQDNKLAILGGILAIIVAFAGQLAYFGFGPGSATDEVVAEETSASETESSETSQTPALDPNVPSAELA